MQIAIALAILLSGYFSPVAAQEWRTGCPNEMDPDLKIQYCTQTTQSGDLDNKNLAIAFTHRAAAYAYKKDCDRAFQDYNQATRLAQLGAAHLSKVQPMAPTHEMSAFPHMPGGQLL